MVLHTTRTGRHEHDLAATIVIEAEPMPNISGIFRKSRLYHTPPARQNCQVPSPRQEADLEAVMGLTTALQNAAVRELDGP
jgi:hypothetical protein